MKNLKKLVKSELKKIHGGGAPICPEGEIPCRHAAKPGIPAYWSCEPETLGCRIQ
ncbi:bacteriocin-like protein [Chryseobacterium lactis]|uniref:bacteriocin-like protein n=1 Tax=Chryseobacterium lactis TaxID=1241981 RepID=UPI000AC1AFCA|nr:hypothetical protein [Chryseobacterium lactis]